MARKQADSHTTVEQVAEVGKLSDAQVPPGGDDSLLSPPGAEKDGVTDLGPRCEGVNLSNGQRCGRMLAVQVSRPWTLDCPRCNTRNERA